MDYLKFLGSSLLAIVAIGIGVKFTGASIGLFIVVGCTIGIFFLLCPTRYAIAYTAWLITTFIWQVLIQAALRNFAIQYPQKYSAAAIHTAQGFWLLVGMILLHPACYGATRLVFRRQRQDEPSSPRARPTRLEDIQGIKTAYAEKLKARRNIIFRFGGVVLVVLFLGKLAEYVLHIPRLPFEYFLCLCALLAGAAFVTWHVRTNPKHS